MTGLFFIHHFTLILSPQSSTLISQSYSTNQKVTIKLIQRLFLVQAAHRGQAQLPILKVNAVDFKARPHQLMAQMIPFSAAATAATDYYIIT